MLYSLRRSGIIAAKQVHIGDGVTYVEQMAEQGETCDLIAAFYLDWRNPEALVRRLIPAAQAVLPNGRLLITSDIDPMMTTRSVLDEFGIPYITFRAGTDITGTAKGMLTKGKAGEAYDRPHVTIYDPTGIQAFGKPSFFAHSGLVTAFEKNSSPSEKRN